jgi:hypothetical protein
MELKEPEKPPFFEKHWRGQPSAKQLGLILFHRAEELVGHKLIQVESTKLAADLMAPTASKAQVKIREAAWAKRDEVWAAYRLACREYEEAQRNVPEEEYDEDTAEDRKRKRLQKKFKKDEKAKELREAYEQIQRAYEANRPEAIRRFTEKLEELSNKPASDAMARYGMCECSASHALAKSVGLCVAVAAETYWRAHPVSAPREPLDVPKLLREVLARVPDLRGADSVSSIMMLRLDGVEVAPPRRHRHATLWFRDGSISRRRRNGLGPVGLARFVYVEIFSTRAAAGDRF